MTNFFRILKLYLRGGIPDTETFERKLSEANSNYILYHDLQQSPLLSRYRELAAQLQTSREQTGLTKVEYNEIRKEFKQLSKNPDVQIFFRIQSSRSFRRTLIWNKSFEDNFIGANADDKKWITVPYQSYAFGVPPFTQVSDNHVITGGENLSISDSVLTINTIPQLIKGVTWTKDFGFLPVEKNYSSGVLSSGDMLQRQYGKVDAKVRFSALNYGISYVFWLGTIEQIPNITIFHVGKNLDMGVFYSEENGKIVKKIETLPISFIKPNKFYIFGIEWTKDKIIWKINGRKVFDINNTINTPLNINLSSIVEKDIPIDIKKSTKFDIDWVKVYEPKN